MIDVRYLRESGFDELPQARRSAEPLIKRDEKAEGKESERPAFEPRYLSFSGFFDSMTDHRTDTAILSPAAKPLTYGEMQGQIQKIISFLNGHGLGRNDRIGVVIPDGPEMAIVFLGTIACATFVPFMQHYRKEEYESLMSIIGIKALIVKEGADTHASSVAAKLKIPIIEVKRENEPELFLEFSLQGELSAAAEKRGFAESDDIAMVLTTSGTTSVPKIVPLTHSNVFSSAHYIVDALRLTSSDRSLHVLPMTHIAGLVSAVLSPLVAGSSIICTPGFSAELFFGWLREFQPTLWYAVPTMHQAVAEIVERESFTASNTSLRFIRSIASPIAEPLVEKMEKLFGVPFLQAYGMTEALTISCTPLEPYRRKPGSVGMAFCSETVVIMEHGSILGTGETGEIVVRGPHVFKAYENNPEANEKAFVRGWFRTGDVGYMDGDGYLYITGRAKDIINRGGEKVSPYEVETALLSHPAVRDACVFGVKHTRLGEAVAAVVILKDTCRASEREIRSYIAERIADYKVPQQIIFVTDIPKTDLGKVQRTEVRDRFLPKLVPEYVAPETETEVGVAKIWREVLDVSNLGRYDNFFALGGDSLLATRMMSRIKKEIGIDLPLVTIFRYTTLKEFSEVVFRDPGTAMDEKVLFDLINEIEGLTDEEARESLRRGDKV